MRHTEEAKRKIGAASRARNSAAIATSARWKNHKPVCVVSGCKRKHDARGLCNMHYIRWKKNGNVGDVGSSFSDSGHINAYGYKIKNGKGEHVIAAEKALGHHIPEGAIVHHVNEDVLDNRPENLVICPNRAYHNLIHARMRAFEECGNANWLKCPFCKQYDNPENLYVYPNKRAGKHRECYRHYREQKAA